ncbi:MAG: hypothetical protein P8J87_18040, partial [Verrucomicrobiales bacterium]|nr:hypothetical protein [Verrucomicrobiales bacterium]
MSGGVTGQAPALPARGAHGDRSVSVIHLGDGSGVEGAGYVDELRTVVTVGDLLRYLKSRWKLSAALAILMAAGVSLFLVGRVPQYESEACVLVKMQGDRVFNFDSVVDNRIPEFSAPALLNNHRAEMGSQRFRDFVADSTGVEVKERFVSGGGEEVPLLARLMGGAKGMVKSVMGVQGKPPYAPGDGIEVLDGAFLGKLFTAVKTDMVKETHILQVLVRHPSPEVAAEMANLYVQCYAEYVSVQDSEMTQKAREFLEGQAEELRGRVVSSERKLLEYRRSEGLVEVD